MNTDKMKPDILKKNYHFNLVEQLSLLLKNKLHMFKKCFKKLSESSTFFTK